MRSFVNTALVFLLLLPGCGPSKRSAAGNNREEQVKTVELQLEENGGVNKIVFLTMSISVADSVKDEYNLQKMNIIYADGTMKNAGAEFNSPEPQYLYCEILNADKEVTDRIRVENPLLKVFEYSEEGSNQLQKKAFTAKQGEFVIRFNFNRQTKYLSVYKLSAKQLKKIYNAQL